MDYLDSFNRQEVINERARCSSELNMLKVKKEDESVKNDLDQIKDELNKIIQKCDQRLKAQKEEKVLIENSINGENMIISMQQTAKMQTIMDTVRTTAKMKTGDSVEGFVCGLSQLYSIEVKPKLADLPNLETEFVNCAKGL